MISCYSATTIIKKLLHSTNTTESNSRNKQTNKCTNSHTMYCIHVPRRPCFRKPCHYLCRDWSGTQDNGIWFSSSGSVHSRQSCSSRSYRKGPDPLLPEKKSLLGKPTKNFLTLGQCPNCSIAGGAGAVAKCLGLTIGAS